MLKAQTFGLVAALVLLSSVASAGTIDFSDTSGAIVNLFTSGGFQFSAPNSGGNEIHTGAVIGVHNNNPSYVENVVTMTKVGGGTFSLHSMDLDQWVIPSPATGVVVTGVGGTNPTTTLVMDSVAGFQTLTVGSGWIGLTSVTFVGSNAVTTPNYKSFYMDNIVVDLTTASAVPLPSAAWLGLGLMGVLGAARRMGRRQT